MAGISRPQWWGYLRRVYGGAYQVAGISYQASSKNLSIAVASTRGELWWELSDPLLEAEGTIMPLIASIMANLQCCIAITVTIYAHSNGGVSHNRPLYLQAPKRTRLLCMVATVLQAIIGPL